MSRKEAGRLGWVKTQAALTTHQNEQRAAALLRHLPRQCEGCKGEIPYEKRRNRFCSHSCAAATTNRLSPKRALEGTCGVCAKPVQKGRRYCVQHRPSKLCLDLDLAKTDQLRRNILLRTYGRKCWCCQNTQWMDAPIPIELDHVDGNATNNDPANLRLLCPNCHAQTPTYKGKNIGRGRRDRKYLPVSLSGRATVL